MAATQESGMESGERTVQYARRGFGFFVLLLALGLVAFGAAAGSATTGGNDWPKYLSDNSGSGFNSETLITAANASNLSPASGWPFRGSLSTISTQLVTANGFVYWGSWGGYEHGTPQPGTSGSAWEADLGQTYSSGCNQTRGVASTGAVASVTLPGQTTATSVLFVGGGGTDAAGGGSAQMFALNALTGAVVWHTVLGSATAGNFMWSSPVVYKPTTGGTGVTSVYVGVASFGDCPLVPGKVVQLNAATGAIQHTFNVVPSGCTGGGVWGSPTIDAADGSLYVATGNGGSCATAEPYAVALLKLRASDLTLLSSWQIPQSEQVFDGDFGSAPTLFSGTVTSGGAPRSLVGIANKNGIYYVFDRSQLGSGPVKRLQLAVGGDCPECGVGSIAPSAWDGTTLYAAGGNTTINGTSYAGSVRAWNPNNLTAPLWQAGLADGPVLEGVAAAPGIVAIGEGSYTEVLRSSDGAVVFRRSTAAAGSNGIFYGPPSISHGVLYEADTSGYLYAYVGSTTSPPTAPTLNTATAGNAQVALSWSPPSSTGSAAITNYKIYRGTTSNGESLLTTVGNVTSYTNTGLTNGTTYYYKVSAYNGAEGPLSNEKSATPAGVGATVPGAPTNVHAAPATGRGVQLSWSAPSDGGSAITHYNIYRGTSATTLALVATPSALSYKDTSTTRGLTYFYAVSATNAIGEGPKSAPVSSTAT